MPDDGATIASRAIDTKRTAMTPAVKTLQAAGIAHEIRHYEAGEATGDYGIDAAKRLGLSPDEVFKTLVAETDAHALVVALVPVSGRLNLKKLAATIKSKKAVMANPDRVEKTTGYVIGGVSPLGQKKRLETIIDNSAKRLLQMHVSGGRRGLELSLEPFSLAELTGARFADIADAN